MIHFFSQCCDKTMALLECSLYIICDGLWGFLGIRCWLGSTYNKINPLVPKVNLCWCEVWCWEYWVLTKVVASSMQSTNVHLNCVSFVRYTGSLFWSQWVNVLYSRWCMHRNLNNVVYICCIIRNQLNWSKFLCLVHSSFPTHVGLLLILALPPHFPSIVLHLSCDEHFK